MAPDALVLYSSTVPRQNAAAIEQYAVRLTTALLQKAEIRLPSEVAGKFKAMAARQNDFVSSAISAAQDVVLGHRTRVASFQQKFKTALQGAVSNVSATAIARTVCKLAAKLSSPRVRLLVLLPLEAQNAASEEEMRQRPTRRIWEPSGPTVHRETELL